MKSFLKLSTLAVFVTGLMAAAQSHQIKDAPLNGGATGTTGIGTTTNGTRLNDVPAKVSGTDTKTSLTEVKDVSVLNSDLMKYNGMTVRVRGEVEKKVDAQTVILESGVLSRDEIFIMAAPTTKGTQMSSLKEDDEIDVTGKVYMKSVDDFKREFSWKLAPQTEKELSQKRAILIVDEIVPAKK